MVTSMVRVVMLSTNLRSWLMTMTAFPLLIRKSSSHCMDSMSRWLVGSSSNSTSGFCSNSLASSMRMRHPPLKSLVWRLKSSRTNPVRAVLFPHPPRNWWSRWHRTFAQGGDVLDKFHVTVAFVVGTRFQFLVEALYLGFHFMQVGKGLCCFLEYGTAVFRHKVLRKVSYDTVFGG